MLPEFLIIHLKTSVKLHKKKEESAEKVVHKKIFIINVIGTKEGKFQKDMIGIKKGDMIETDCNCDSAYMLSAMDRVGQAIRASYHWVPRSDPCYLVMDNAGGHGSNDAIEKYVRMLDEKYNVKTIFQVPRSPYTNVLDLGVWCSLQLRVENMHYMKRCEVNALARLVKDTWDNGHLDDMNTRVFNRLRNFLVLINEAKGKNDLVEEKRGKKFRNLDLPVDLTHEEDTPELVPEIICAPEEEEIWQEGNV